MTDTMKLLSDTATPATIVILGVAETVTELLAEHESIGRNLAEIHVPPMEHSELSELVSSRFEQAELPYEEGIPSHLGRLAQAGYPHYAHLLGLWSARSALDREPPIVTMSDVRSGVNKAVGRSMQSLSQPRTRRLWNRPTRGTCSRKSSLPAPRRRRIRTEGSVHQSLRILCPKSRNVGTSRPRTRVTWLNSASLTEVLC